MTIFFFIVGKSRCENASLAVRKHLCYFDPLCFFVGDVKYPTQPLFQHILCPMDHRRTLP